MSPSQISKDKAAKLKLKGVEAARQRLIIDCWKLSTAGSKLGTAIEKAKRDSEG